MAKGPSGALVAARDIAIDGVHYEIGAAVAGVNPEQLAICVRLGSVVPADSAAGQYAQAEAERRLTAEAEAA